MDLGSIFNQIIKVYTKKPEQAKATFESTTSWSGNLKTESQVGSHPLVIDEPKEMGGTDAGPNPLDTFLATLGACQEITYAAYASVMGLKLDKIVVEVKGDIDLKGLFGIGDTKPAFSKINYVTRIISPEPEEKIRQLVTAVEAHCPILDTIKSPISVEGHVEINQK